MEIQVGTKRVFDVGLFELQYDQGSKDSVRLLTSENLDAPHTKQCTLVVPKSWQSTLGPLVIRCNVSKNQDDPQSESEDIVRENKAHCKKRRRRVKNIQAEDEEDKAQTYNVACDETHWPAFDHVAYVDERFERSNKLIFLDKFATTVVAWSSSAEFVITPDGEVCAKHGNRFGMYAYLGEDENTHYAPGRPRDFVSSHGKLAVLVEWLQITSKLKDAIPDSVEEIVLQDHSSLPLTAFCADLSHITDATRKDWMSNYLGSMVGLDYVCKRPTLGMWFVENGLKAHDVSSGANLHDFLEFYHVRPQWIWRTCLGDYIWFQFVCCAVDFGAKPNLKLVEMMLQTIQFEDCEIPEKTDCDACGKRHVVKNRITLSEQTLDVGCVCLLRIDYLFRIGKRMRAFRCVAFDVENALSLCSDLCDLRQTYQDKLDMFKDFFHKS